MAEPGRQPDKATEPNFAEEMAKIPYEPLLPVEKKLIAGSLILGVVLLGLLWIGQSFLPLPEVHPKKATQDVPAKNPVSIPPK